MKGASTHLFKRQSKNGAFFKIIEHLPWFKTPRGTDPRARQRSETRMCESPGVIPGGGWSGLELTQMQYLQWQNRIVLDFTGFY